MKTEFEVVGFHIDVYINNKYTGSYGVDEPDRDVRGYGGRKTEILQKDTWLKKGTKNIKVKKGTTVETELHMVCGKVKNNPFRTSKKSSTVKQINTEHIEEALRMFNGYWANDYQACDDVADKYEYDRERFTKAVFNHMKK